MNTLLLSTKNELSKLLIKKKYLVITILGILICILRLGSSVLISKLSGGSIIIKSNLIMEMLGFVTDIYVPLIVFLAVTDLFTSEAAEDTLKASLLRPVTRFKVMMSKSLAAFLLGCASILIMFLICLIMQAMSGNSLAAAPQTLLVYAVDMIPVISLVALALFMNMLAKGPSLSMLLCIGVYVLFKYMNIYVSPFGQMIFTAYSQWHKIWLGSSLPAGELINKVGILFGSVLILFTASYIIFDRKDY